jgi:hypothetical protein
MLSTEQLKSLKQVNVSKDADKTKQRLKEDFSAALATEKRTIVELSGQKRTSFYRAYEKGAANARIILAMAIGLKVSPYYYIGEQDERNALQDSEIIKFLEDYGYTDLAAELKVPAPPAQKRKYTRKPKDAQVPDPAPEEAAHEPEAQAAEIKPEAPSIDAQKEKAAEVAADTLEIKITLPENKLVHDTVESLSEEQTFALLKALLIRAQAGGAPADMAKIIKRCLLI